MARAKFNDVVTLANTAVIALVAYFVWRAFNKGKEAIDDWTKDAAEWWVGPSQVRVLGRVVLPNGQSTTVQSIINAGGGVDSKGFFRWQGTTYQITGRNADGDYTASRIIS